MTPAQIKELREAAMRATLGPWRLFDTYAEAEVRTLAGSIVAVVNEVQDARLIALAGPDTILSLLDRLEEVEKDAARYAWWCDPGNDISMAVFDGGKTAIDAEIDALSSSDAGEER